MVFVQVRLRWLLFELVVMVLLMKCWFVMVLTCVCAQMSFKCAEIVLDMFVFGCDG